MAHWDVALMAMIAVSSLGFVIADGEGRRVRYVQAMRRCLLRMNDIIRYEQPPLEELLLRINMKGTQQEREMTRLLHTAADDLSSGMPLAQLYAQESAKLSSYGVLSAEDRAAFEGVIGELGQRGLYEQLRLIEEADERMRCREETLRQESGKRAQLIRTLSLAGGAAVFLILA